MRKSVQREIRFFLPAVVVGVVVFLLLPIFMNSRIGSQIFNEDSVILDTLATPQHRDGGKQ